MERLRQLRRSQFGKNMGVSRGAEHLRHRRQKAASPLDNLSRKDTIPYFTEKKVSVNGHIVENNDKILSAGDSVSVRGFGKFNIIEEGGLSRKGKLNLVVEIFGR